MNRKPVAKRIQRTPTEVARLRQVRERFQKERPSLEQLVSSGDYDPPVKQVDLFSMLQLGAQLKQNRQARKLSLAQVAKRSGIDKAALSRIENGQNGNPTIGTLETIARAIGARIRFSLESATPTS